MQHPIAVSTLGLVFLGACASSPTPQPETPAPEPQDNTVVEVVSPPQEAPPPEPTEEEKAKAEAERAQAEAQARLAQEREAMRTAHQVELERWTPELREQAKALAEKKYPNAKAALTAAVASPHRKPENVARDAYRHPVETLEFFGFKPTMTVLEYSPGGGWYTEILAPALAARGKLLATNTDPAGPPEARSTFYGERFKLFLETSPEAYGKVETVLIDGSEPKLDLEGNVDLVLAIRTLHGMVNAGTLNAWLNEFHKALKPNGVLGIVQHRAQPDAVPEESSKQGYLPEAWVISQVEAAGFKLAGKSEINANPNDTKDHPHGVWSLPPSLAGGDQDREKYVAIGESDRMTLKFVKVKKKP